MPAFAVRSATVIAAGAWTRQGYAACARCCAAKVSLRAIVQEKLVRLLRGVDEVIQECSDARRQVPAAGKGCG